jgi:hypothetical protein
MYYVQHIPYLGHYLIIVVNLFVVCLKFGLEKVTLKASFRLWTKKSIVLHAVALHLRFFSTGVLFHTFLEILADFCPELRLISLPRIFEVFVFFSHSAIHKKNY